MFFHTDIPKLSRNQNCEDKWKAKKCKKRKKKGHCKKKKVAKKCKKTCEKCSPITCPGNTIPNGDGNCLCPGNTIDYGNGNCSCIGDTVNDGVGNCSCPIFQHEISCQFMRHRLEISGLILDSELFIFCSSI